METKLEQLLLNNKFSDLSFEDKEYVLSHISQEDYTKTRLLLKSSKQAFKQEYQKLKLNTEIKNNLNIAFREKFKKQHFSYFQNILSLNKSILKPSLGFVGFIILFAVLYNFYKTNTLQKDIDEVTTFLLHENRHIENLNLFYSSDSLKNNLKITDTLKIDYSEMNKFLNAKTEGLNVTLTTAIN
jgi:hypothetical protein